MSGQGCVEEERPPAFIRIDIGAERIEGAEGTLQECKPDGCGEVWKVKASRNLLGDWTVQHLASETYVIARSGFFTKSAIFSGDAAGQVTYAFGTCAPRSFSGDTPLLTKP